MKQCSRIFNLYIPAEAFGRYAKPILCYIRTVFEFDIYQFALTGGRVYYGTSGVGICFRRNTAFINVKLFV